MRTKFTKASQKDKTLVTVSLAQFDKEDENGVFERTQMAVGDAVYMRVEGQSVIFEVNRVRDGKATTAVTHCFPRFLRLPRVGRPVFAQVTEVE